MTVFTKVRTFNSKDSMPSVKAKCMFEMIHQIFFNVVFVGAEPFQREVQHAFSL